MKKFFLLLTLFVFLGISAQTVKVSSFTVTGNSTITTDGGTSQLAVTVLPTDASVKDYIWSVSNPKIATINAAGLLTARKNGRVTVTATSTEPGSTVSGSMQIAVTNQPVPGKEFFLDFGPNDGTNGDLTPASTADVFGNYWNNITTNAPNGPITLTSNLVDNLNTLSSISVIINSTSLFTNGKLNGALLTPNTNYLGELGVATATEDYFSTTSNGTMTFAGLDVNKGYRFRIFAARDNTAARTSTYEITGLNSVAGNLQTSGTNLSGTGVNTNNNNIYVSDYVYPKSSGEIVLILKLGTTASSFAYLNVMKIEEFEKPYISVTSINVSGNDISNSGATSQMTATVAPSNASITTVKWSVSDPSIALIDANGILHPLKNGTVTVTATSSQTGSIVSGSKQISITNQIGTLYIYGSATENGTDISSAIQMSQQTDANGYPTGIFQVFAILNSSGTFNFSTSKTSNAVIYGAGATVGTLSETTNAIDPTESGAVLITVNMVSKTYSVLPTNSIEVVGDGGKTTLTYKSKGIWSGIVSMANIITDANPKFNFQINSDEDYILKRITGSINKLSLESQAIASGIPVEQIPTDKNSYAVTLDLNTITYTVSCPFLDNLKIAYMGSSVAFGTGAAGNQGYNYQYTQLLSQRYAASKGLNWSTVNISVPGNSTVNLLSRIGTDLFPLCTKYVVYGVSLGNEGIHGAADQQAIFNQFKNNMLQLITMALAKGLVPIVTNCYTRNDFTLADYSYVRQMDMLIHEWDVPSVNLLGAIDDGTGKWAPNYWSDVAHPNDAGHREFTYSMIPSLFDALEAGKPLPVRATGNYMTFDNNSAVDQLTYTPDNTLHSFTHSFEFKSSQSGILSTFKTSGILKIDTETGAIVYSSPLTASQIKGNTAVNDNKWHRVTLTHFYARGESDLYIDSTFVGKINEQIVADKFKLNDLQGPDEVSFRDWFFYRAGMNQGEISAICAGKMLKSGLELYAPLYGQAATDEQLKNIAQSTTVVNKVELSTAVVPAQFANVKLYPNPVQSILKVDGLKSGISYEYAIYGMDGRGVQASATSDGAEINVSMLPASFYVLVVTNPVSKEKIRLSFSKF